MSCKQSKTVSIAPLSRWVELFAGVASFLCFRYELGDPGELPEASPSKVTLFIDVDETIVYVTPIPLLKVPADRTFAFSEPVGEEGASKVYSATPLPPVSLEEAAAAAESFDPNASQAILYVYHRPFVKRLLMELRDSGNFEVIAFTAALPEYANPILDTLEEEEKLFDHRLYRHHCCRAPRLRSPQQHTTAGGGVPWPFSGDVHYYVKDLAHAAQNRDIRRCVLLDNSPVSFAAQMENGIYLRPFCGDPGDDELQFLSNMLFQLHKLEDVRGGLQTGLINAAWRSLVERDQLYELAGIPRPAPEIVDLGVELTNPSAPKPAPCHAIEETEEVQRGVSEIEAQTVTLELPLEGDSQNVVEEVQMQDNTPVAKPQEVNGQEYSGKTLRNGSFPSVRKAPSSTASVYMKKGGLSRLSARNNGGRSELLQSQQNPKESRLASGHHSPLATARSQRTASHGVVPSPRRAGPRTPRSTDRSSNQKDVYQYSACYEAGRARVEAAEAGSVVNRCRSSKTYHGDSWKSLVSSNSATARKAHDNGHTVSCLKRQEREGTTWCRCTGTKSSASPVANRDASRRRSGSVLTADSNEGMSHATEQRANRSRERSDALSRGSSSYYVSTARGGEGARVPRLHLQGLAREGREAGADWSSDEGFGEEPATPGKQPLTPTARKTRLANIDQILEDSVALSRQCPEPMAQSRSRFKQPATMYGCPDIQAPNLLCGRQEESRRKSPEGRQCARPAIRHRKGKADAEVREDSPNVASQSPGGWNNFPSPTHPHMCQYPGYPRQTMQEHPGFGAASQQMPYAQPIGTPGWPSTPRFLDANNRARPATLNPSNMAYAPGTPRVIFPASGYGGSLSLPQIPYEPTSRCTASAGDYATMRQHVNAQPSSLSRSPGPSVLDSWTSRTMAGMQYHQPTTTPSCQGIPAPMTARATIRDSARQQHPKLFAGRRMRLGDLFGGCTERTSKPEPASTENLCMGQSAPNMHVRPAVLVRREESPKTPRVGIEQMLRSAPTASRPLIMPYVAPTKQAPHAYPPTLSPAPSRCLAQPQNGGGFGRGSLPPVMQGGMGGSVSLPSFYSTPQRQGWQLGFPAPPADRPWMPPPRGLTPALSASMSALPQFS